MRQRTPWRYSSARDTDSPLAVSARLMPVSASPMPATSPASRRPQGRRSPWQSPKTPSVGTVRHPAPAGLSGHALRQPFASSLQAPAGSDVAGNAPADKGLEALALVTAPSDGLKARRNRRPCNAICPARSPRAMLAKALPGATPSHGELAHPDGMTCNSKAPSAPSRVPRRPMIDFGTKREWCPGSLVVLATLRRCGRTETLT